MGRLVPYFNLYCDCGGYYCYKKCHLTGSMKATREL
jgi:hypothetical protein